MPWETMQPYNDADLQTLVRMYGEETRHGQVLGHIPQGAVQHALGHEDDAGRVRFWAVWHNDFPIASGFYIPPGKKDTHITMLGSFVLPSWQRQGIYSAVLDLIEKREGKPVGGDIAQTEAAQRFWRKRGRPAGTTSGPEQHVLGRGMTQLLQSMDDVRLRTDYSGRGMYGRTGLAIVTDRSPLDLFAEILNELIDRDSHKDHYKSLALLMENAREDRLGDYTLVYFPGVTAEL